MNSEIMTPGEAVRARAYQMKRLWLGISGSLGEFAVTAIFWFLVPEGWFQAAGFTGEPLTGPPIAAEASDRLVSFGEDAG